MPSEGLMLPPSPRKDSNKLATSPPNTVSGSSGSGSGGGGGGGLGRLARSLSLRPKKERQGTAPTTTAAGAEARSPRSPVLASLTGGTSSSDGSSPQNASPLLQQQVIASWGRPPAGATVEDAMREASGILTDEPAEGSFSAAGYSSSGGAGVPLTSTSNHVRTPSSRRRAQEDRDALLSPQPQSTSTFAGAERTRGHSRTGSSNKLMSSSSRPSSSSGLTRSPSLVKRLSLRRNKPPSPPPTATSTSTSSRPVSAAPSAYATLHRGRRSFDSLTSAVEQQHTTTPLLTRNASARRTRENSGPASTAAGRALISSTARAKPAREGSSIPLVPAFPGGYWAPPPYAARSGEEGAREKNEAMGGNLGEEAREQREELRGKQGPFWAVKRGWKKGVYTAQEDADTQTRNFPGPIMRKFDSPDEAIAFLFAAQPAAVAAPLFSRQDSTDVLEPRAIANTPSDSPRTSTLGRSRSLASGDSSGRTFGRRRGAAMGYADVTPEAEAAVPSIPDSLASPPRLLRAQQHKPDLSPIVDRSPAAFNTGSFAAAQLQQLPSSTSIAPRVPEKENVGPPPPALSSPKQLVKSPSRGGAELRQAMQSSPSARSGRASPFSAAAAASSSSFSPPTPASMAAAALGVEAFRSEASVSISPFVDPPNSSAQLAQQQQQPSYKAAYALIGSTNVPRSTVFYISVLGCTLEHASASRAVLTLPTTSTTSSEGTGLRLMLRADVSSGGAVLLELGNGLDMHLFRETIEARLKKRASVDVAGDALSEVRRTDWNTLEISLRGPEGELLLLSSSSATTNESQ